MNQKDGDVCSSGIGSRNTIPASTAKENAGNQLALREKRSSDVAIIGISGRFAGSVNLEAFWSHLQAGESCIKEIQRKGWETRAHTADPDPERLHTTQIKWGGLLQDIDQFDPLFFNISPLEAAKMDPQQRLFLEEAYKAFEDGGYSAAQLAKKKVGVFVGARPSDYKELVRDGGATESAREGQVDAHLFLGNDMAILAARISYFLNLKGPGLTIDTASSSNVEEANPEIDFQNSPFFLNTELLCEWKRPQGSPRRAGVSSFGLSGTNCHVILEEPPLCSQTACEDVRSAFFFPFSAKTKAALARKVEDMLSWLEKEGEKYSAEDISYTLVQGRSHFSVRAAVVAKDTNELKQYLREIHRPGDWEQAATDEKRGHAWEQTELLFKEYGTWLLQELPKYAISDQNSYKEKISILAGIYVQGYNLDWGQIFQKEKYHRVPLPTYPFTRGSYWIDEGVGGLGESETDPGSSPTLLQEALSHIVSSLLKVRVEDINVKTELSEYGFDSITFTELANRLNQTYQLDLTPAHFFEHSTIERLAWHLHNTSTHEGREGASPSSTQRSVDVGAGSKSRGVDDGFTPSRPLWAPVTAAEPIAIIGMSGVFPQASDVQSLWSNLLAGRDCISEIPASRWDWQTSFGDPVTSNPNQTNIKWAGIVEDVELFDPLFFGISRAEAEQMDPQQRLLMMYVWKAIEDAGYAASSLSGTNTALFIGTTSSGYSERLSRSGVTIEGYSSTGQTPSVGPGRISYFLNLHGPSEAIETACSSSLIAIHRGVSVIESGVCNMAIVGGVNTLVSPERHISFSKAGMLSPDGRCKTFSDQANGYVRGEGVGMLVLKKLSEAEQAGDQIYGVILGSAENHGGRASSLTAPNPGAQADLLIAAYRKAGIDLRTVSYIEAHGTGTALGDPIEINGLKTAFSELAKESMLPESCGIGSVKSNIGHLEWAAGVTGVIKVLLQMQHKKLVKSLHCEQVNPYIQLEGSPFYIVRENREWEAQRDQAGNPCPRRAGVSSFGFGGANAHVVLEEYVPKERVGTGASPVPTIFFFFEPY